MQWGSAIIRISYTVTAVNITFSLNVINIRMTVSFSCKKYLSQDYHISNSKHLEMMVQLRLCFDHFCSK